MVKYFSFDIPKEGVSREVLETDLPLYLGQDAKVVDSHKSDRYIVHTTREPPRSMIASLKDDTSRWRRSDDYQRRLSYAGSHIHRDRKQTCRADREAHRTTRVAPITVPSASRPPLVQQYSSSSGSVFGSMQGSPGSTYDSLSRYQSRRESDAMSPVDGGAISRTISVSSVTSDYGTSGSIGWNNDPSYGTNGGYGFATAHRRPSAYGRP